MDRKSPGGERLRNDLLPLGRHLLPDLHAPLGEERLAALVGVQDGAIRRRPEHRIGVLAWKAGQLGDPFFCLLALADVTKEENRSLCLAILHDRGAGILDGKTRSLLLPEYLVAHAVGRPVRQRRVN